MMSNKILEKPSHTLSPEMLFRAIPSMLDLAEALGEREVLGDIYSKNYQKQRQFLDKYINACRYEIKSLPLPTEPIYGHL